MKNKLLEFITLPQIIMALLLTLVFVSAKEYPNIGLIVIFALHVVFNIAVIVYQIRTKTKENLDIKVLYIFLAGMMAIFSCGVYMIFNQFSSVSIISPETLYLLFNLISLIYLSWAIIKKTAPKDKLNLHVLILLCFSLPVAVYLLLQSGYLLGDVVIVIAIGLLCVFMFLVGKLIFVLCNKSKKTILEEDKTNKTKQYSKKYRIFVAIAAILLPQIGLLMNNNFFWEEGVLGDFSSIWFHIIVGVNGLLLLVDTSKIKLKFPLFFLKAVGFTFITYFALIFIPYMPYAIIGIIFYGLGLLVYVPAVIFVIQLKQLSRDFKLLKNSYNKNIIRAIAVIGFIALPTLLLVNFTFDRTNFNKAMAYVNEEHNMQEDVNIYRLRRSVKQIEATMLSTRQQGGLTFMPGTPIISTTYRYIALDNMYFTQSTITKLIKIFMPETIVSVFEIMQSDSEQDNNYITEISVNEAEYDPVSGSYKAWIDFELTWLGHRGFGEYRTSFTLPDGCFITDHYLYVFNKKKRGIITDKRVALVAYESIIRTPKDPGIIYYENDNIISLRVFPFGRNETRKTGFQIMYSQNETLHIAGKTIELLAENPITTPIDMGGVMFIPQDYKNTLSAITREPMYYFLVDAGDADSYVKNLEKALRYSENISQDLRFFAVSFQAKEITDLTSLKPPVRAKGGFNVAHAMSEIYSSVLEGYFPVIILVTENINRTIPLENTQLTKAFPETDCYYRLNFDFSLTPYRFLNYERLPEVNEPIIAQVLNYKGHAINREKNETIINGIDFIKFTGNQYQDAFILQNNTFLADSNETQIQFIKESMNRRLLTKNTAFIVMETKEQEDMLLSLQEQFLSGSSVETPSVMMNEPAWVAIVILFIVLFLWKRH